MIPEVILISRIDVDWPTLRKNIHVASGQSPSNLIAQCPVKFSQAAEYLVFAACLKYNFVNKDPLQILRTLPHEILNFLHYSFLFACDSETYNTLRILNDIVLAQIQVSDGVYCILGTGTLFDWKEAITLHLSHRVIYEKNYRILFDKLLILMEQEGLGELFSEYRKKSLPDKTFVLEKK